MKPERKSAFKRLRKTYRVFGPYLGPYKRKIALAYVALGVGVLATLARPWPLKLILDGVLLRKMPVPAIGEWEPQWIVLALCGALVAIVAIESTAGYFQKLLFARVGHSATTDVLEHTFTHLQTLPRGAAGARSGDVIVRLTSDVKTMRDLLVEHVQKLGTYALSFAATLAVMASMNVTLTLLGLSVVPLIWLTSFKLAQRIRAASRAKRKREGAVASVVHENLNALTLIQAFAQEERERARFRQQAQQSLEANVESSRLGGAFSRWIAVLSTIGTALVIGFGAMRALDGTLSPGDLVVFAAYLAELYKPIQSISDLSAQFMDSLVSGERVLELLEAAPRIHDSPRAAAAPRFRGVVEFEDVTFGYQADSPVVRNLSFRIEPGQSAAIVGGSGAGKSTILHLLLRFQDPQSGRVLIDGTDIRQFRLRSLREQIGVVLQESLLFRRSVRENIAYGRPSATNEQVKAAAEAARAHEFIEQLPDGYDTVLDESGANLSGGQRQRLSLARAFLRDAPILFLDEPTSGLDTVTEAQLSETLRELARGRTTLTIAHRLATIEDADLILVLDRGELVQQGTHEELARAEGLYRELVENQAAAERR